MLSHYFIIFLFICIVIFALEACGSDENSSEFNEIAFGLQTLESLLTTCWSFKLWVHKYSSKLIVSPNG
jgi:uncharacterized lipoprotein YehR (DUF1307 family)